MVRQSRRIVSHNDLNSTVGMTAEIFQFYSAKELNVLGCRNRLTVHSYCQPTSGPSQLHYTGNFIRTRVSIRIDSFCKKNRPFDSLIVMQFLAYLLYSLSQKIHHNARN